MLKPFDRSFWYVSPLTHRILAVNVAALLVLVLGLLYTGQYERGLIDSETSALKAEGRLFAAALAEDGLRAMRAMNNDSAPRAGSLGNNAVRTMLLELTNVSGTRVIVFDKDGGFLLDSRRLLGSSAPAPLRPDPAPGRIAGALSLPLRLRLPSFPPALSLLGRDYPGIAAALKDGAAGGDAWQADDTGIVLTAALPVRAQGKTLGAIFLMRPARDTDAAVHAAWATVMKAFVAALLVTVLFSLFLSETIVYPIVRLAEATKRVRQSILLRDSVPDFGYRGDEIGDLSRAFREMTQALAERIDAVGRFAADVAHEIKNPLASVKSAVETFPLVKEEEQKKKLLSVIHHDINRINRLITDISNASRLDSELSRAERGALDLSQVLQNVVDAERSRIGDEDKIVLYLDEGRKLPVTGNAAQLAQVAHNLIDNALSFVPEGNQVTVRAGLQGKDRIFMHVDNPGPSIPESKLEAVFERFYSSRPKTEKFGMHSGLGLSISRQIIRMHQGEIFAENLKDRSGEARGVRFMVLLPAGAGTK
jgi:two-component system sensor histidine kinase ChvG